MPSPYVRALLVLALLVPTSGWAGCLEVNEAAAFAGTFGLEAAISTSCLPTDLVVEPPPADISGEFKASQTVTATGVQVVAPGAEFRAGQRVRLDDGFSIDGAASFSATVDDLLDSPFGFVEDDSPDASKGYGVRFYLDLAGMALTPTDRLDVFSAFSSDGTQQLRATLTHNDVLDEDRLVLAALEDGGGVVETPFGEEILLPAGYNSIELRWLAEAGTGSFVVSVNGDTFAGLTGLDNDQGQVDMARLGITGGTIDSASGSLALDDFSSFPLVP